MSEGVRKLAMMDSIWLVGRKPFGVMVNPVKSMAFSAKWDFFGLKMTLFWRLAWLRLCKSMVRLGDRFSWGWSPFESTKLSGCLVGQVQWYLFRRPCQCLVSITSPSNNLALVFMYKWWSWCGVVSSHALQVLVGAGVERTRTVVS